MAATGAFVGIGARTDSKYQRKGDGLEERGLFETGGSSTEAPQWRIGGRALAGGSLPQAGLVVVPMRFLVGRGAGVGGEPESGLQLNF